MISPSSAFLCHHIFICKAARTSSAPAEGEAWYGKVALVRVEGRFSPENDAIAHRCAQIS